MTVAELCCTVNGEAATLPSGSTVADVVTSVLGAEDARGIAVAVDLDVVPKSAWASTPVADGACIEIVTAAAGG